MSAQVELDQALQLADTVGVDADAMQADVAAGRFISSNQKVWPGHLIRVAQVTIDHLQKKDCIA